ncbi:CbtA family protein [Bradyrhizobium sp.]|uniref:CbtA family protein n=1 Tax=Bradyrhizobium sp. TaxID=376 RepID=UPI0025C2F977|nr:CbtA family protein [Bradyrhizobium sp.]MBV8921786.1 CbtA family protein [Bradyrhizobium sp.]
MNAFRAIVFAAVVAGLATGLAVTVIQQFGTVPLILKAEVYEKAAEHHGAAAPAIPSGSMTTVGHGHGEAGAAHEHAAEAWEPRDGLERNAYTAGANVLTAIGFALMLAALFAFRGGGAGATVSWHDGLVWGLAGFVVFTLAPSLGLPPELPGVPAAPLLSRQIWWVMAAAATAAGLGLIFLRATAPAAIAGLILLMLPHVIGAPELTSVETNVPSSLAHQFVVAVALTSLVFWSLLGALTSIAYAYFDQSSAAVAPARPSGA